MHSLVVTGQGPVQPTCLDEHGSPPLPLQLAELVSPPATLDVAGTPLQHLGTPMFQKLQLGEGASTEVLSLSSLRPEESMRLVPILPASHPKPAYHAVSHEHLGPAAVHRGWCGLGWAIRYGCCPRQSWQSMEDILEKRLQHGLLAVRRPFWRMGDGPSILGAPAH